LNTVFTENSFKSKQKTIVEFGHAPGIVGKSWVSGGLKKVI